MAGSIVEGIEVLVKDVETGVKTSLTLAHFVRLYDVVFETCISKSAYDGQHPGAIMYRLYTQQLDEYLKKTAVPKLNAASNDIGLSYLKVWCERWYNYQLVMRGLYRVFMYLERFYVPCTKGVLPLLQQGRQRFRELVYGSFKGVTVESLLAAISRHRDEEELDTHVLQQAVQVFVDMEEVQDEKSQDEGGEEKKSLYESDLEVRVIECTADFYRRQGRRWLNEHSCSAYLLTVEKSLAAERRRVTAYLRPSSMEPLLRTTHSRLLVDNQTEMLNKPTWLRRMLEQNCTTDLALMYRLNSEYPETLKLIADIMVAFYKEQGRAIVDRESKSADGRGGAELASSPSPSAGDSHALVCNLIKMHDQFDTIVEGCFGGHRTFRSALRHTFQDVVNVDMCISKLLAKFVNDVLKKHSCVSGLDGLHTLDNVARMYGYIDKKDVFERDYQHYLANRLLMDQSKSGHSETAMIAKLSTQCGYGWPRKLQGMFSDVQQSQEMMVRFHDHYNAKEQAGMSLNVTVCTTGFWPGKPPPPCKMPPELSLPCEQFRQYYLKTLQNNGERKLQWHMGQGQAEVRVTFSPKVRRTLICTTYQMVILMAFNSSTKPISFRTLLDLTGTKHEDISDHLLSLIHPKVKVLLKKPNVKFLKESDLMKLNPKFSSKVLRLQIPLMRGTVDVQKRGDEEDTAIRRQRECLMDGAIVRICKTRKKLRHVELVGQVMKQLSARFTPDPQAIKKRIEVQIVTEYLRRSEEDRSVYEYIE